MHHKMKFIVSLMILAIFLQSCAIFSVSPSPSDGIHASDPFSAVAEGTSPSETEQMHAEGTTQNTVAAVTEAQTVVDEVIDAEIVYSFYAVIDSVDTSHPSFIVTQTSDASFSSKGTRFSLHVTDDTSLTAADGTEISFSDFSESDQIGVIIDGLIAETDPASPEYVTMISLLDN